MRPVTEYHAHVYYDELSRSEALRVREGLASRFDVNLGRWRDQPVGPHPQSMYQVAFAPDQFAEVVPWIMQNRGNLNILVHPETGQPVEDHRDRALWMGEKLELRLNVFRDARD